MKQKQICLNCRNIEDKEIKLWPPTPGKLEIICSNCGGGMVAIDWLLKIYGESKQK
ncbi:MAG: hypothetical protein WC453_02130 [Patescibacteria group bacterium]